MSHILTEGRCTRFKRRGLGLGGIAMLWSASLWLCGLAGIFLFAATNKVRRREEFVAIVRSWRLIVPERAQPFALPLTARHTKATMAALSEACSASNQRRYP
ncbi:MAG: hypothetical protein IH609_13740 [Dehalococcoidia bacterium]|nr:hypothetical protein [Dehalococcoidia bacterium]